MFRAARGIAFFGVPHQGMNIDSFKRVVGNGSNAPLIYSLSGENSELLRAQGPRFERLQQGLVDYRIHCVYFYETELSPTAHLVRTTRKRVLCNG